MKQLNETFYDNEYEMLKKAKGDKTWRVFLLGLIKEVENNGDKKSE